MVDAKIRKIRVARAQIVHAIDQFAQGDKTSESYLRSIFGNLAIRLDRAGIRAFARSMIDQLQREETLVTGHLKFRYVTQTPIVHLFIDDQVYHLVMFAEPLRMICQETGDVVHLASETVQESEVRNMARLLVGLEIEPEGA